MRYNIIVFKSRSEVIKFADILKRNNIPSAIINTPSNLRKTCGLSVKVLGDYIFKVHEILNLYHFQTFDGIYETANFL